MSMIQLLRLWFRPGRQDSFQLISSIIFLVQMEQLRDDGWNTIVVWECELSNKKKREERLNLLLKEILGLCHETGEE